VRHPPQHDPPPVERPVADPVRDLQPPATLAEIPSSWVFSWQPETWEEAWVERAQAAFDQPIVVYSTFLPGQEPDVWPALVKPPAEMVIVIPVALAALFLMGGAAAVIAAAAFD
jgi:hypothetical protein